MKLSEKLDLPSKALCRMEAENVIKWCLMSRKNDLCRLERTLKTCKEKASACTTRVEQASADIQSKLTDLCGLSKHCSTTEAYFVETAYKQAQPLPETLELNELGQVMNLLPLASERKRTRKTWTCEDFMCKLDDETVISKYHDFLKSLSSCTLSNVNVHVRNIQQCGALHANPSKRGHPSSCYADCTTCKSTFISTLILAPHFPSVRYIKILVYRVVELTTRINKLDTALDEADVEFLQKQCQEIKENATCYEHKAVEIDLDETNIQMTSMNAFKALTERIMDTPVHACISCEKLCFRKDVLFIANLRIPIKTSIWLRLVKDADDRGRERDYVCIYCVNKLRKNEMPSTCVLNNLQVQEQPAELACLNDFEKILIQRAKAFQVVLRMGNVANKKLPAKRMIQKVKGRTFHLPLPTEETLNRICPNDEPINNDHELHILVRGLPNNKTKTVWENLVNVNRVLACLVALKIINRFYKDIKLPKNASELLDKLKDTEFAIEEDTDEAEKEKNDCDDAEAEDERVNGNEPANGDDKQQKAALLTQMSKQDGFYEQYTIYPVNEKRVNETSTTLYQMKKINDVPLDNRVKALDLLCFPDLYPYGKNGQHEDRTVRLSDFEYIKLRLMSKHPQFRLNIQYLFYLLNDNNIRQIKAGIYHKLNVPNPRLRYTAGTYLDLLNNQELEQNLDTVFSRLRNTAQYWKIPRNNLQCMVDYYGPATWFLTLSPAEWLWTDLVEYVRKVNAPRLDKVPAQELIATDPVSASRFIDNKFHAMLDFICSADAPLGKVAHYFWRREYQGRGTQHFHMLLWVENAPVLGESTHEQVAEFILKHVTCQIPDKNISPTLYERVITHQRHTHNGYCLRSKKTKTGLYKICRFGFPRPLTENLVLRDAVTSIAGRKTLKTKSRLYDVPRAEDEKKVNDYNPTILTAWEGNMDIQFCGEKSAVITYYVTKYETKPEKTHVANTWKDIDSTKSLNSRLWAYTLRSLSHRECGALEAADTLLGIPLYGTDSHTTIKWLNVNEIRSKKLKNRTDIENLNKDSTDLFCPNLIDDFYPARPKELEAYCLYDFAKWFDYVQTKPKDKNVECYEISKNRFLRKRKRECLINHFKYKAETHAEKYFFSLLFLFKPWRNVEELKNGCETYAQAFDSLKTSLDNAMKYHQKRSEIDQAFQHVQELIKKQIDENDKEELSGENASLECNPIEAHEAMKDFKGIDDNVKDADIANIISQLNLDQKRVFDKVTNALGSDSEILRLYVSGEGGTGKSYLIYAIRCWIKQVLQKRVAITAPTGIAAFSIQGLTIHRLFQLPVEHGGTAKYRPLSDIVLKKLREDLCEVSLIIIDEVSMISNITLMYIHLRLAEIFDTGDTEDGWFAKKHVLLFGDLLQLPPVHESPAYVRITIKEVEKFIGSCGNFHLWKELFAYEELRINMRQKGDTSYRDMLSRIRVGLVTNGDIETLEKRKIKFSSRTMDGRLREMCTFICSLSPESVCLFPTRNMCEVLNKEMLARITAEEIELRAYDSLDCKPYLRKKIEKALKTDDDDCSRSGGLPQIITVKIGAKIMLTRNIDVTLGLVNGTIGIIKSVSRNVVDKNDVENVTILLSSSSEHTLERASVKFEIMDGAYVIRKQFPLCLSYAITIHKSQGLSLKEAVVDAGNRMFAVGQVYVALSRVTSLDGLHLINFDPASVKAKAEAIVEYNRLRKKYRPDLPLDEIATNPAGKVFDEVWAAPAEGMKVQGAAVNNSGAGELQSVQGLSNPDGVSCYANSTLQCIFNCNSIKKELLKLPKSHVLRMALQNYMSRNKNVDVVAIRHFVNKQVYCQQRQQDVVPFIADMCNQICSVRNTVEYSVRNKLTCRNCAYSSTSTEKNIIISLPVSIAGEHMVTLQQLLDEEFGKRQIVDARCDNCSSSQKFRKSEIASVAPVLIIQLKLFGVHDGIITKIEKCPIKGVPSAVLDIGGHKYKAISAILHTGTLDTGHYVTMIRQKKCWLWVSDATVTKKTWPNNAKGVYVFFLERHKLKVP